MALLCRVGDSDHPPDQSWNPLLPTPNNPSYPSSLSGTAGVAETVFQSFYGTDSYIFGVGSESGLGNNTLNARFYTSFSDAAKEVVESRLIPFCSASPSPLLIPLLCINISAYATVHPD